MNLICYIKSNFFETNLQRLAAPQRNLVDTVETYIFLVLKKSH